MTSQPNSNLLVCFAIGIVAALIFRSIMARLGKDSRSEVRKELYDWGTTVSLQVLLPVHLFLTTALISLDKLGKLAAMPIFGVMVCLLTYVFCKLFQNLPSIKVAYPAVIYLAPTFGGGNRGFMMIFAIITFAPVVIQQQDLTTLIDSFALLDVGYFVFYLTVIRPIMTFGNVTDSNKNAARRSSVTREIAPIILGFFLGSWFNFFGKELLEEVLGPGHLTDIMQASRSWIGYALATLTIALTMLIFDFELKIRQLGQLLFATITARILGFSVVAAAIASVVFALDVPLNAYDAVVVIPLIVLFVCPPSSFADKMMSQDGSDEAAVRLAATFSGLWNSAVAVLALVIFGLAILK